MLHEVEKLKTLADKLEGCEADPEALALHRESISAFWERLVSEA